MGDKVKEFRDKNPVLDFLAGFIPGIGEAQDIQDFSHAAKKKDYLGMGLAGLGLLPGISGRQISTIISGKPREAFMEWARRTLEEMHVIRPRLDKAIKKGNERAIRTQKSLEKIKRGEFHIAEKPGPIKDVNPDHVILLKPDEGGYTPTFETMLDASLDNVVTNPKGELVGRNYIVGVKGTNTDKELIPGLPSYKIEKDKFGRETVVLRGQFTSDDIITALYYSGYGKVKSSNAIYRAIEDSATSERAKDYAKKELANIERILIKYAKQDKKKSPKFMASGLTGKGRDRNGYSKIDKGKIPKILENPQSPEQIKDVISLHESANKLSQWFGAANGYGVTEFYQKKPINTLYGNYFGNQWGTMKNFKMSGVKGSMFFKNQDDLAEHIAASKDPILGIVSNIMDGAGNSTDIIMQPDEYNFKIFKKGGRFTLTTYHCEDR